MHVREIRHKIIDLVPEISHICEIVCKEWKEDMIIRDPYNAVRLGDFRSLKYIDMSNLMPFTVGYLITVNKQEHLRSFMAHRMNNTTFEFGLSMGQRQLDGILVYEKDKRVVMKQQETLQGSWWDRHFDDDSIKSIGCKILHIFQERGENIEEKVKDMDRSVIIHMASRYPAHAMDFFPYATDKNKFCKELLNSNVVCIDLAKKISEFVKSYV